MATDLGSAASIEAGNGSIALNSNTVDLFGTGTFTGSDPTTLEVAYFAVTGSEFWTSGSSATETNNGNGAWTAAIKGAATTAFTTASRTTADANGNAWVAQASNGYYKELNKGGTANQGSFDNFYTTGKGNGEAALLEGPVSLNIFDWKTPGTKTTGLASAFTLITTVDSSGNITTTEAPAATPIPASVLLLGSGLLGLVGIRRRNLFNF